MDYSPGEAACLSLSQSIILSSAILTFKIWALLLCQQLTIRFTASAVQFALIKLSSAE
jgi:hypothetical protein